MPLAQMGQQLVCQLLAFGHQVTGCVELPILGTHTLAQDVRMSIKNWTRTEFLHYI